MATATKAKPETAKWLCMACGCNNPIDAGSCETCEVPRGEGKPSRKRKTGANGQANGVPTTQAEAAAKEAAASLPISKPAPPAVGATEDVPIGQVDENPVNTRCNWGDLDAVAESMQRVGQLQECTGRRKGKRVELIAGARRYRAAKVAGLKTLRVRIVECDDLTALDIMGEENEKQHTWDSISRAAWLQAELEARKMSTRQLAEHLKVSQADVANHLRLLKLPKAWQDRVISQEITSTQARALATWSERTEVLKEMEKALKRDGEMSTGDFEGELWRIVRNLTRPCDKGDYYSFSAKGGWRSGSCLFTDKHLEQWGEELDIVTLTSRNDRNERRAFNLKRWDELHGNLEKEAQKKADARATSSKSKAEPSETDLKRKAEQQARLIGEKVWRYKTRWLQQRAVIAVQKVEGYLGIKLLIGFASNRTTRSDRGEALATVVVARGGKVSKDYGLIDDWQTALSLPTDAKISEAARDIMAAWLSADVWDSHNASIGPGDVVVIAEALGVDLEKEWRVDETFLGLFTTEQLRDLAKEWGHLTKLNPSDKRGDRIRILLEADQAKRLPAPKILLKAKG